jgi:3-deoxy-D-manno-octulosonic-acid transferase
MDNFPFIDEFYTRGAALKADESSLCDVVRDLLSSPSMREQVGTRAGELLKKNRGAVVKALDAVERLVGTGC